MPIEVSESVHAIRQLIRTARSAGLVLEEGATAREPAFSARVAVRHAHQLWERAARALGPALPIMVAADGDASDDHASLLHFAAMTCATLGEALELCVAHWRYVSEAYALHWVRAGEIVQLVLDAPGALELGARLAVEHAVVQLARTAIELSGGAWQPVEVVLGHQPPGPCDERWAAACRAPLRVDPAARPGLALTAASLALPVRSAIGAYPAAAHRFFVELLEAYTPRPRGTGRVAERVSEALGRNLSAAAPTVDQIASELSLSARSLHRQLAAEGTSYQRLLDGLRCDEAIRQAIEEHRPFKSIATAVGFSDPRAFRRAFKRWTGSTPQAFRARHA
ncbi:MAG TPA: helix-turn-helix domain-containing protein [Kofleriaceae bacterium]|nr:helix-turn-helix domain-containing protein [Kofleriaceae bacterium]